MIIDVFELLFCLIATTTLFVSSTFPATFKMIF